MKSLKYIEIAVESLVVILFTVCMLFVPVHKSASYWISFAFSLLSLIVYIVILQGRKRNGQDGFLYMILPIVSFLFTLLQIAWNLFIFGTEFLKLENLLGMAGDSLFKGSWFQEVPFEKIMTIFTAVTDIDIGGIQVVHISVPLNVIVNLLLSILYVVVTSVIFSSIHSINQCETEIKNKTRFMKDTEAEVSILCQKEHLDSSVKRALEQLSEKIRYSDPVSSQELQSIESEIAKKVCYLRDHIFDADTEDTLTMIHEISGKVEERNIYNKRRKGQR